jgi:protocatechuate 3,4-dioxygenase beta subunit
VSVNNNFLDVQQASLGDRLWVDTNADGQQNDGATGIVGQTVTLIGGGADHLINGIGDTTATTTTGTDGVYHFTGLNVGEQYQVQFSKPVGTVFTKQNVGSDASDSDVDLVTGKTQVITLAPDENNATLDAGVYTPASIGDYAWYDKNANGIQDTGETGIGGVKVTLTGGGADGLIGTVGDNTTLTTTTNTNGLYLFDNLTPGTQYQVAFDMPVGFNGVSPRQQGLDTAKDSDGILSNVVVLTSGQFNQTIDAGFFKAGIAIEKWVHSQTIIETPGDAEGLTPGFWKNHTGLNSAPLSGWPETGRSPTDSFEAIFGVNVSGSTPTLLDALGTNGGGESALLRHAAAALLNASDPYVNYAYTVAQVIAMTQAAYVNGTFEATKNLFATQNELGADLTDLATSSSTVVNGVDMDADLPGSGPTIGVGDKAVFTYVVANTGDTAIGNVLVTDNRLANVTYVSGDVDHDGLLDLTETWTYTATETVSGSGQIGNIGTVTGTSAVAGGPAVTDSDAAYYQVGGSAVIGDRVWEDTNANGIQDAGENGIAGVTVLLKDSGGNTRGTTTTDVNGNYIFDVAAGVYSVAVVPPSGYLVSSKDQGGNDGLDSDIDATTKTTAAVTITTGEVDLSLDAGLYRTAELGDRVWLDANRNGMQDTGEAGVSGVKVTLLNASGVAVGSSQLTDANGNYLFTGLKPGTYSVQFDKTSLPVGYVITTQDASGSTNANDSDASSVDGKTIQTVLDSGESDRTWDMGVQTAPAAIGDRVWLDSNENGLQDTGEVGVANVTVKLLDAGGAVLTTQTTDINGNYLFSGLNSGNYAVQFAPLSGYGFTTKDAGADGADSDADIITGKTITTTLTAGEVDRSWDAGLIADCRPVTFDFSGNSATDGTNGNSRSYTDALTGVSVTARAFSQEKGTNTWQSAWLGAYGGGLGVTDSSEGSGSGNTHTVDNVGRNNYIVLQFSQAVEIDKAYLGYVSGDSDVQVWVGNFASTLTTMSNAVLSSMSFSEVNTTVGTGARWADLNAGEVSGNIVIIAADTTDTSPEDYFKLDQVAVCAPNMGTPVAKASIGDFVWEDKNYNGVQDSGETGIANVTVKLLNSAGIVVDSTTTDASGKYLFDGLNPADYKVQVVAPSGYYVTKMDQGTNNAVDSDVNSAGITAVTTLSAGENDLSWDAGLYRKVSVGDKVWDDMNHNNIQDASEPGIANIKVNLMNASGTSVLASTTTNANGNYLFANLDPGTYVLQFDKANVQHYNYGAWYNMSNWKWAVKDAGTNDAIDSDVTGDATATTNVTKTSAFTLVSGQNDMTKDAGITPIAIDLNGDGIHTVSRANSEGTFDLLGNGKDIQSGWLSGDDGFLAIDSNGNGLIDNISELFGGLNKGDGFSRLGSFDSNGDGLVNFRDNDFAGLKIWQDLDGNHKTDAGELLSLTDAGVTSLNVNFNEMPFLDAQGNLLLERGSAELASGNAVEMTDVYFNVSAADAGAAGVEIANMASLIGADPLWMV